MAEFLDIAFKGFCIIAAPFVIASLIDSYCRAFKVWKDLSR